MSRAVVTSILLVVLSIPGLLSTPVPAAQPTRQSIRARGTVVALNRETQTLTIRDEKQGTMNFRLVAGTVVEGADLQGLRVGQIVQIWGVRTGEGIPVALRIATMEKEKGPRAAGVQTAEQRGAYSGLVISQTDSSLTLLRETNAVATILISAAALLSGVGEVPRLSVVEVVGARNSDGSVSARSLEIVFDPRRATRVTGKILVGLPEAGFVLSSGTVVTLSERTWVVRGTALQPTSSLVPGARVLVLGHGQSPYVGARIIEILP
jgi:hypothetical protein